MGQIVPISAVAAVVSRNLNCGFHHQMCQVSQTDMSSYHKRQFLIQVSRHVNQRRIPIYDNLASGQCYCLVLCFDFWYV